MIGWCYLRTFVELHGRTIEGAISALKCIFTLQFCTISEVRLKQVDGNILLHLYDSAKPHFRKFEMSCKNDSTKRKTRKRMQTNNKAQDQQHPRNVARFKGFRSARCKPCWVKPGRPGLHKVWGVGGGGVDVFSSVIMCYFRQSSSKKHISP